VEAIIKDLVEAFKDPSKKVKACTMYLNLRMSENERLENFFSTAYTAQAGLIDDSTKREDLLDKIIKPLREGVRPCLDLVPTLADLHKILGLGFIFWNIEAEKKRAPRVSQLLPNNSPPPSLRKPSTTRTTVTPSNQLPSRAPSADPDIKRQELRPKGACFNCSSDIW
jgi:hypothetical protein